jgi:hypothetical protein
MKTMKIYYILLVSVGLSLLSACSSDTSSRVEDEDDRRRIYRGEQIGFITEEMDFTEEEAQRFWPIFNTYRERRDSLWHAQRTYLRNFAHRANNNKGSDALNEFLDFERAKDEQQRKYVEALQEFMSDERILQLFYTEYQFKHFMLNRIRGRHGHGEGRGRGRGMGRGRDMDGPPPPFEGHSFMDSDKCIR